MKRAVLSAALSALAVVTATAGFSGPAQASERDKKFFKSVEGDWSGPGEIVAGKYKGTKFVCTFNGDTPDEKIGLTFDGGCRVGMFTQKMSASIVRGSRGGYKGTFLDGAEGKGLDVVSGGVDGRKVVLSLNRNQLNGTMTAKLADDNSMTVTISVRVEKQMVPMIGMSLKRVDGIAVGSIEAK